MLVLGVSLLFSKFRCGCEHGLVNQHGTSAFTGRVVQVLHFRLVTQPLWNVCARAFQKLEQFSRTLYAEIPRFNDVSCKVAPLIVVWLLRHQLPAFWLYWLTRSEERRVGKERTPQ